MPQRLVTHSLELIVANRTTATRTLDLAADARAWDTANPSRITFAYRDSGAVDLAVKPRNGQRRHRAQSTSKSSTSVPIRGARARSTTAPKDQGEHPRGTM